MAYIENNDKSSTESDFLRTDGRISDAVKEIVIFIMEKYLWRSNKLHLNVNVKSSKKEPSILTWFYIKICTSCEIKTESFTGSQFVNLGLLVEHLQSLESESHMCIQYPRADGQSGSVQENVLMVDHKLCTVELLYKPQHTDYFTIYLRVPQELWQMSKECRNLYNFMLLSKVFRPKDEFNFSMNLGEVLSDTDFRAKSHKKVSPELPELVTDPSFYVRTDCVESNTTYNGKPSISTSHIARKVIRLSDGSMQEIVGLTAVGLCFQCDNLPTAIRTDSSSINITIYGPNFVPYKGDCSNLTELAESVDWYQFGVKLVKTTAHDNSKSTRGHFHGDLTHKKSCHMDKFHIEIFLVVHSDQYQGVWYDSTTIQSLMDDSAAEVVKKVEAIIGQILQPLISKAKMRSMVHRSIRSVCKGVKDIVSMSSSDTFHSTVLGIMKVSDTVELGNKLESQLQTISAKRHPGVWGESLIPDDIKSQKELQQIQAYEILPTMHFSSARNATEHQESGIKTVETIEKGYETSFNSEHRFEKSESCLSEDPAIQTNVEVNKNGTETIREGQPLQINQIQGTLSPFTELALKQEEEDAVVIKTPKLSQHTYKKVSPFQEFGNTDVDMINKIFRGDSYDLEKTPEIIHLTKYFKEVSPFQELSEMDAEIINNDYGEPPCVVDKTPKITQLTQCLKEVSPFKEHASMYINVKMNTVGKYPCAIDKTPEITQLTKSFEKVSPFQELGNVNSNMLKDVLDEDPFKDYCTETSPLMYHFGNHDKENILVNTEMKQELEQTADIKSFNLTKSYACCRPNTLDSCANNSSQTTFTEQKITCNLPGLAGRHRQRDELDDSHSLCKETVPTDNERLVDNMDDDSDGWFDAILDGVNHWLQ